MTSIGLKAEELKNLVIASATGGQWDDNRYQSLRLDLINQPVVQPLLPQFIRSCRTLREFWEFIKVETGSASWGGAQLGTSGIYARRRVYLRNAFEPLLTMLETGSTTSASEPEVSGELGRLPTLRTATSSQERTGTLTASDLGDLRRQLRTLLDSIERAHQTSRENPQQRVLRLRNEGLIPWNTAGYMLTIIQTRNTAEYERDLSQAESDVVTAAWRAIQEWHSNRGDVKS